MRVTSDEAKAILRDLPSDKAFYFYTEIDHPILQHSRNLNDFVTLLRIVDSSSVEFHIRRGDFERWISMLGDRDLVEKIHHLREEAVGGDDLRKRLLMLTKMRVLQLSRTAKSPRAGTRRKGKRAAAVMEAADNSE